MELNCAVFIGVDSEKVPENIVQLSLTLFKEHFHDETLQLFFGQVSL